MQTPIPIYADHPYQSICGEPTPEQFGEWDWVAAIEHIDGSRSSLEGRRWGSPRSVRCHVAEQRVPVDARQAVVCVLSVASA